jgi:hypothetical protein
VVLALAMKASTSENQNIRLEIIAKLSKDIEILHDSKEKFELVLNNKLITRQRD